MRKASLLGIAILSLFAFAGFTAMSAFGEDPHSPSILVLEGFKATQLEGKGETKEESELVTLGGKTVKGTAATTELKGCKEISGFASDTNLCEAIVNFKGTKQGAVACRSETSAGAKDAVETILTKLDVHLASEESLEEGKTMELQPLLLFLVLGISGEEELIFNCGGVKDKVRGTIACLATPGLVSTTTLTLLCKVNSSHDPVTGHCEQLCEWLEKHPGEATLNGSTFEDAWESIHIVVTLNHPVYIDD